MANTRDAAVSYLIGTKTGGSYPEAIGKKFAPDANPLECLGNTTICHVPPGSAAFSALVSAQARLKAGPHADAFAFLPANSLHMTIFEGVIDYFRTPTRWPEHMAIDASVDAVTADLATRLDGLGLPRAFKARPTGIFGGFSVRMTGADAAQEALLRQARDMLRATTGIKRPDHASYAFHITLGYLMRWLSTEEANLVMDLSESVEADLLAQMPQIDLGPVEFCRFSTMERFERLKFVT